MLYLDEPREIEGLTVFRDYNDRSQYYYLPSSPRLSRDATGQPLFQLLIYRERTSVEGRDDGGGFLTMTVDLGVDSGKIERIEAELGLGAKLAPVQIKNGTVRISALDQTSDNDGGGRFIEKVIASARPSLYGDQRAVFTAELSQDGATLMKAALERDGATPVSVIYSLDYEGLRPAYQVKITIKFEQSYNHLRSRTQANTLWFKTDIDRELEELEKNGSIKIEEVNFDGEDTAAARATRATELQRLARELATWTYFSPGLNPGRVLAAERGNLTVHDPTASATTNTSGFTTAGTGVLSNRSTSGSPKRNATATTAGQLGGQSVTGSSSSSAATGSSSSSAPSSSSAARSSQPSSTSSSNTGNRPLTAVERWNRAGRPQAGYMLRSLQQEERQEIIYELSQVTVGQRGIAPQGQISLFQGASDLPGRILEVDLGADFFKKIQGQITTEADLDALGIASAVVKLRYGIDDDGRRPKDEHETVLQTAGQTDDYQFFLDSRKTREIAYQIVLNHKTGFAIGHDASQEETDWIETSTRHLEIDPQQVSKRYAVKVQAGAVDWQTVRQIQIEMVYADPASQLDARRTLVLNNDSPETMVFVRPRDTSIDTIKANCHFVYADGATDDVVYEREGSGTLLINQPADTTRVVQITMSDPSDRYERISIELVYGEGDDEVRRLVTMTDNGAQESWSYRVQPGQDDGYRYTVTKFTSTGVEQGTEQTGNASLLVVGDLMAGTLAIEVHFIASLAEGGIGRVLLKLSYDDAPDWADSDTSRMLTDVSQPVSWSVPMQDRSKKTYTYQVTWFKDDGSRVEFGPNQTNAELLILDPKNPEVTP